MGAAADRAAIRAQAGAKIDDWASLCTVTRFVATTTTSGHKSGTYTNQFTNEKIWIQPRFGRSEIDTGNLNAETTHLGYQNYSGNELLAKDRIVPAGDTYAYDVVATYAKESNRLLELKRVERT